MAVVTLIPQSRPLTAADLESMPDDGHRYELIDSARGRSRDLSGRKMVGLPALAIEVLSPSTRLIDLNLKKAAFEKAGVESCWVVDPDGPAITVWQLIDDAYVEVVAVTADEPLRVEDPFPMVITPSDLVR